MLNSRIQSYSLGCLRPDEVRELREAIKKDPEFNFKELGKYQNLAALLPLVLPNEIPDHRVKEKVARRLYRLKEKTESVLTVESEPVNVVPAKDIAKEIIARSATNDPAAERYIRKTGQVNTGVHDIRQTRESEIRTTVQSPRYKKKSRQIFLFSAGAFLLGLLAGFILFFRSSGETSQEADKLRTEVQQLNTQLINNNGLLTLLEKKDTRTFALSGSETYPDGFGKVFVNSSSNRGYIYFKGVPALGENNIYQLWIYNGTSFVSAALLQESNNELYHPFNFPVLKNGISVRFMLTEEPAGGSAKPGRKVYLTMRD